MNTHFFHGQSEVTRHAKEEETTDPISEEHTDIDTAVDLIPQETSGGELVGGASVTNSLAYRGTQEEDSSDNESSTHSLIADVESKFEIDWEEVKEGRAAGLPSQWEAVPQTPPNTERDDINNLYIALRMKASAYANKEWQEYWNSCGPGYLIECWKRQHPDIPLKRVEIISGLGFLCETLESKMQLDSEADETVDHPDKVSDINDNSISDSSTNITVNVGCDSTSNVDDVISNTIDRSTNISTNIGSSNSDDLIPNNVGDGTTPDTNDGSTGISDEDILTLWNEFYNTIYWYTFEVFQGPLASEAIPPEFNNDEEGFVEDEIEQEEEGQHYEERKVRSG